jgi:hypothetical protein
MTLDVDDFGLQRRHPRGIFHPAGAKEPPRERVGAVPSGNWRKGLLDSHP